MSDTNLRRTSLALLFCVLLITSVPLIVAAASTLEDFEGGAPNANWEQVDTSPDGVAEGNFSGKYNSSTTSSLGNLGGRPDSIQFFMQFGTGANSTNKIVQVYDTAAGQDIIQLRYQGGTLDYWDGNSWNIFYDIDADTWYWYNITNIGYGGGSATLTLSARNGTEVASGSITVLADGDDADTMRFNTVSSWDLWFDYLAINGTTQPQPEYDVSGYAFDGEGQALDNVTITANDSGSTSAVTDANGSYTLSLTNGTYTLTASKSGYENDTATVTLDGGGQSNVNFTLNTETDLRLEVPAHLWQNETGSYTVWNDFGDTSEDVTANATVTSSDPANLTVNQTSFELEATDDLSFNGEITITAEYQNHTVSKNVTVANLSVEHMDLMQDAGGMTSALWGDVPHPETGDRRGGTQLTMRILLIAVLVGAAVSTWSSSFGGIGGVVIVVAAGWFMGWVGDGMAMITVFAGLFVGLNVAANIDYSVRK